MEEKWTYIAEEILPAGALACPLAVVGTNAAARPSPTCCRVLTRTLAVAPPTHPHAAAPRASSPTRLQCAACAPTRVEAVVPLVAALAAAPAPCPRQPRHRPPPWGSRHARCTDLPRCARSRFVQPPPLKPIGRLVLYNGT